MKNDEKVEVIFVKCLECGQEKMVSANGIYVRYDLNYFCHDKDCEDKYAIKS
jgi:hypothetical protein